jgi:[acyl-carrier-protein] S-malonyltransferase
VSEPREIVDLLVEQVTAMVRWRECILAIAQAGVEKVFEVGAGKVLTGLVRRIAPDLEGKSIAGPDDIESVAAVLG